MSVDERRSRVSELTRLTSPGPYLAKIVNNVDPMRQGSLEVELLNVIGNQGSANQQIYVVRYLTPFYGATDIGLNGLDSKDFNQTQKSYGFWFVPPDTGSLVMVIFVDGDPSQGYWMGCVQDAYMNYMIPGIAGSKSAADESLSHDEESWGTEKLKTSETYSDDIVPVGELNRKALREGTATLNKDVDANVKPVHPMARVLLDQGLIKDTVRGVHTSSARRETPSNVFGISTPGPRDKRKNAQQGTIGKADGRISGVPVSRLGGTTLIMDDGNDRMLRKTKPGEGPYEYADLESNETDGLVEYPKDESFRIRTRTGHQILMHNSEDLIYITNASGTAWMEFTSNGKIDIYCEDSISIRSEQDFNFVADRDINLHAGRSLNLYAANRINAESIDSTNIKSGVAVAMASETTTDFHSPNGYTFHGKSIDLIADEGVKILGRSVDIYSNSYMHLTAANNIEVKSNSQDILFSSDKNIQLLAGVDILLRSIGGTDVYATAKVTMKGSEIHLNGPEPKKAVQAREAVRASTSVNAGGGGGGGSTSALPISGGSGGGRLTLYPLPGVGQVLVKRAPTAEPWEHHENFNPEGFTPDLTDREAPQMPFAKDAPRLNINNTEDARDVPGEQGGQKSYGDVDTGIGGGGAMNRHNKRAGRRSDGSASTTNANESVTTGLSDAQLARMNTKWTEDTDFLNSVKKLAAKYQSEPKDWLAFMYFESGGSMSPSKTNSIGCVGLIQFCASGVGATGKSLGQLKVMTRVEQMIYIEKYFDYWVKTLKIKMPLDLGKCYMIVGLPAYVNTPDDEVIATQYDRDPRKRKWWEQNPAWRDPTRGGAITPRQMKKIVSGSRRTVEAILNKGGISL
jgi:uncharacterized protein (DUF2345 family)